MKLLFKKLYEDSQAPYKKHESDGGFDLYYYSCNQENENNTTELFDGRSCQIHTGIAVQIPKGHVGLIFDRSGLGMNGVMRTAGVIDEGYNGELIVGLTKNQVTDPIASPEDSIELSKGDRIAQLVIVPIPRLELEEVDSLENTDRGDKGFGSSGK